MDMCCGTHQAFNGPCGGVTGTPTLSPTWVTWIGAGKGEGRAQWTSGWDQVVPLSSAVHIVQRWKLAAWDMALLAKISIGHCLEATISRELLSDLQKPMGHFHISVFLTSNSLQLTWKIYRTLLIWLTANCLSEFLVYSLPSSASSSLPQASS